ncbi:MAG: chemotaxis protein CheW [Chloroflexi bacterium]|nr:chemotaxis protein CheW [Chloroflexota bacterium]
MGTNEMDLEQLVVFSLADESYGVDIGKVSGIERMQEITRIPRTADSIEGVINLRGRVIPIVDLRKVFCLPPSEETKDTRIVVVDINGRLIGCMVDAVTEVFRIPADSVEPPSSVLSGSESNYLLGIAKLEDRMIILLDLDKVLALDGTVEAIAEMASLSSEEESIAA